MSTEIGPKRDSMDASVQDIDSKLAATTLQPSTSTKRRLGLTDLPPSVRNKIYAHVLDTELVNLGKDNVSYTHTIKDGMLHFSASRPPFPVSTSLFLVNKEISKEAQTWFYKKNLFITFQIYTQDARHAKTMLEDSGVLFATPTPAQVEHCKMHAMDITLVEKNSSQKRAAVIFPAQYLPRLINFMDQAARASKTWAPSHALFITVANKYKLDTARLQGDLLELFRMLNNMGAVTISPSNLLPGFAEGLQSSMTAVQFDADAWLSCIGEMVDRGVAALGKEEWRVAGQHCRAAVIAMTYAYLTRAEEMHMRPDAFHTRIQRRRYEAELTLGMALRRGCARTTEDASRLTSPPSTSPQEAKAEAEQNMQIAAADLLAAETAASHALSLATDSPSPTSNPWFRSLPAELIPPNKAEWFDETDQARAWLEVGLVHLALGECLFAAGDLERAQRLLESLEEGTSKEQKGQKTIGNGAEDAEGWRKEIEDAFGRAREGIDWSVKPGMGLKRAMRVASRGAE
jgi:hypothetical protein